MLTPARLTHYSPPRNRPLSDDAYRTGQPVLFTVRGYRGRPFEVNADLCAAVLELLAEMRQEYGCWVGAYCLMPDHLHFLAASQQDALLVTTFVERFKGKSTNTSWQHGWSGRLWQRRFHDHIVRQAEGLETVSQYVLNNPVRGGLVDRPEDWLWSGILDPAVLLEADGKV